MCGSTLCPNSFIAHCVAHLLVQNERDGIDHDDATLQRLLGTITLVLLVPNRCDEHELESYVNE